MATDLDDSCSGGPPDKPLNNNGKRPLPTDAPDLPNIPSGKRKVGRKAVGEITPDRAEKLEKNRVAAANSREKRQKHRQEMEQALHVQNRTMFELEFEVRWRRGWMEKLVEMIGTIGSEGQLWQMLQEMQRQMVHALQTDKPPQMEAIPHRIQQEHQQFPLQTQQQMQREHRHQHGSQLSAEEAIQHLAQFPQDRGSQGTLETDMQARYRRGQLYARHQQAQPHRQQRVAQQALFFPAPAQVGYPIPAQVAQRPQQVSPFPVERPQQGFHSLDVGMQGFTDLPVELCSYQPQHLQEVQQMAFPPSMPHLQQPHRDQQMNHTTPSQQAQPGQGMPYNSLPQRPQQDQEPGHPLPPALQQIHDISISVLPEKTRETLPSSDDQLRFETSSPDWILFGTDEPNYNPNMNQGFGWEYTQDLPNRAVSPTQAATTPSPGTLSATNSGEEGIPPAALAAQLTTAPDQEVLVPAGPFASTLGTAATSDQHSPVLAPVDPLAAVEGTQPFWDANGGFPDGLAEGMQEEFHPQNSTVLPTMEEPSSFLDFTDWDFE